MSLTAVPMSPRAQAPRSRHRVLRVLLIILAVVIGLAVIIRLLLDPIASHETRKALGRLDGFQGDFSRVHVTVFAPSYEITNLKLTEEGRHPGTRLPFLFAKRIHLGLDWRALVHGRLVANAAIHEPKVSIALPPPTKQQPPPKTPDLSSQLKAAPSVRLARLEIFSGDIVTRIPEGDERPRLWIHDLAVTGENLATKPTQAHGRPATLSARGIVGRSGELRIFVTADPFASPLSFAGEASLQGLRATELYDFISAKVDLEATQGTIDLFASFTSKNGLVNGGVKPVLKNVVLKSTDEGLWADAKTWLLDKAVDITSDRVPERNAITTTIPIKGRLVHPDIQLWPAVLGVVRNAFVAGLAGGFAHLPPSTAPQKEGIIKQATDALKKKSGPPRAQPRQP